MKKLQAILLVALSLTLFGCKSSYEIVAIFDNVEGLTTDSDVLVNGFKIGEVRDMNLSLDGVNVTVAIDNKHKISKKSKFLLNSSGLFGPKYIEVIQEKSQVYIQEGDTVRGTSYQETQERFSSEKLDSLATTFFKVIENAQSKKKEKQ